MRGTDDPLTSLVFRESNPARLSAWSGELRYTESNAGSLQQWITYRFHLRGDVQAKRPQPGSEPRREPSLPFYFGADDTAPYGAQGTYSCTPWPEYTYAEQWSADGTLPLSYVGAPGTFFGEGGMDLDARTGTLMLGADAFVTANYNHGGIPVVGQLPIPWYVIGNNWHAFTLDPSLGIETGMLTQTMARSMGPAGACGDEQVTSRLEWDAVPLQFPPDPDAAR